MHGEIGWLRENGAEGFHGQIVHGHRLGRGLREAALRVVQKLPAVNHVVGASGIIDPECPAAASGHPQVVKLVAGALGAGRKPPHGVGRRARLRHEDHVVPAEANPHSSKQVVARISHENTQVVVGENRAVNGIIVETQVQRDARRQIVMQIQLAEMTVLSPVTGQTVKLIVVGHVIPQRQTPRPTGGHQAAGTATSTDNMLDNGIVHVANLNAIIVNGDAIGKNLPKFLLLVGSVSVHQQAG